MKARLDGQAPPSSDPMPKHVSSEEVDAINAIYGEATLQGSSIPDTYTLSIPNQGVTLRISFPLPYPDLPVEILGLETAGDHGSKGHGTRVLNLARETLPKIFHPGTECLFDLLQELESTLTTQVEPQASDTITAGLSSERHFVHDHNLPNSSDLLPPHTPSVPVWTLAEPVTVKKSLFLGRSVSITSPSQASDYISYLLTTDKRAAKATHNISAYRLRSAENPTVTYQDCDDDGETAAGGRLLKLLQAMDVWGVLVVVSRWYGGVKLGPDRFRIINEVAREALVKGGWERKV